MLINPFTKPLQARANLNGTHGKGMSFLTRQTSSLGGCCFRTSSLLTMSLGKIYFRVTIWYCSAGLFFTTLFYLEDQVHKKRLSCSTKSPLIRSGQFDSFYTHFMSMFCDRHECMYIKCTPNVCKCMLVSSNIMIRQC